jgi:hypothetical protein
VTDGQVFNLAVNWQSHMPVTFTMYSAHASKDLPLPIFHELTLCVCYFGTSDMSELTVCKLGQAVHESTDYMTCL